MVAKQKPRSLRPTMRGGECPPPAAMVEPRAGVRAPSSTPTSSEEVAASLAAGGGEEGEGGGADGGDGDDDGGVKLLVTTDGTVPNGAAASSLLLFVQAGTTPCVRSTSAQVLASESIATNGRGL